MESLEQVLNLKNYKIASVNEVKEGNKFIKIILVISKNNKQKCPICNEYTSSVYDTLKPIELKYLKLLEQDTRILITKKRFICHECKKMFLDLVNYSDYDRAEEEIKSWIEMVYDYNIPEMITANTIKNWLPYIVNSFIDERFLNGFREKIIR